MIDPAKTKAFIVHLERASDRAAQVQILVKALPFATEVVAAVDGAVPDAAMDSAYVQSLFKPRYPFTLRPAEVATFLSHRKCWQQIIDHGLDAALIVEDDVALEEPTFSNAVDLAIGHAKQGDFVRLPIKARESAWTTVADDGNARLFVPVDVGLGLQAQIVTREAAQILLDCTARFDRPVDTFLQMVWEHQVPMLSVWPSGVREISQDLGGSLIGTKMSAYAKLRREIMRPIYRGKVQRLAKKHMSR